MTIHNFNIYNRTMGKAMDLQIKFSLFISTKTKYFKNISNTINKDRKMYTCYNLYRNLHKDNKTYYNTTLNNNIQWNVNRKINSHVKRLFSNASNIKENKTNPSIDFETKYDRKKDLESEFLKIKKKADKEKQAHKRVLYFLIFSFLGMFAFYESYDPEFFLYDIILQFCLKYLDSELCHDIFIWLGKYNLLPQDTSKDNIYSASKIKQLKFINPFGVAAGFDKNGESIEAMLKLGFSFIEIGTITPKGQIGNEKPRIFRDNETKSIINSCGFNNIGCEKVTENLKKFRKIQKKENMLKKHIVGVSIGKNKNSENIIDDLLYCVKKVGRYADYIVINVSSPNTPGLRDNQEANKLRKIIASIKEEIKKMNDDSIKEEIKKMNNDSINKKSPAESNIKKDNVAIENDTNNVNAILNAPKELREENRKTFETSTKSANKIITKPYVSIDKLNYEDSNINENVECYWQNTINEKPLLFVKLSPDLSENERKQIAKVLLEECIDGMIISNTTIQDLNIECFKNKKGGVSGLKLKDISTKMISDMYTYTNKKIPIIASGGILNAEDALQKIEAGASVCQLYSSLVFNGVKTAVQMKRGFDNALYRKGYYNLESAIGASHKNNLQ